MFIDILRFPDYSSGTSLASFLEFNNDRFLLRILYHPDGNPRFLDYIGKYIAKNYSLIEFPSNVIKYYYYRNLSLHSSIHKVAYTPILWSLGILNNFSLYKIEDDLLNQGVKPVLDSVNKKINWDKYFANAKAYHQSISTNNSWGINNDYYSDYLKNKEKKRRIVVNNKGENQEFNDFIKLLDLLDYYKTNPIFIIQSLNPYAYDNLCLLKPIIDEIVKNLNDYNFPVLNQFICYEDEYEIGMLTDAMHMGDLGWHKVNKFIIENYIINE